MTIKVKLNSNTSGIIVKPSFAAAESPVSSVTVKNQVITVSSGGVNRFDQLQDVIATHEVEGGVPVYNAATDKYEVQKLNLTDVDGPLDGGSF